MNTVMEIAVLFTILLFIAKSTLGESIVYCGYDGEMLADPDSCKRFYKCDHGNPVRFDCGPGTVYNPSIKVCDWPYNVKCNVKEQSNSNTNTNNQNPNTNNYNGGQNNDNGNNGYNGNTWASNENTGNQNDDSLYYPVQNPLTTETGPSIAEPLDPNASGRPRPTIDDLYSGRNNPYGGYIAPNSDIDIRK